MLPIERSAVPSAGWTPERLAKLADLCATTLLSASQIGTQLGVSRNSIISKCDREGINLPGSGKLPLTPEQQTERRNASKRERRALAWARREVKVRPTRATRMEMAFSMNPDQLTRVSLSELTDEHCRWPYGEAGAIEYCGAQSEGGKPYCSFHCAIAYVPSRPAAPSLFRFGRKAA